MSTREPPGHRAGARAGATPRTPSAAAPQPLLPHCTSALTMGLRSIFCITETAVTPALASNVSADAMD